MTGIANLDQHFVILLDLARIPNLEELANVARFEQAACPASSHTGGDHSDGDISWRRSGEADFSRNHCQPVYREGNL